MHNPRHFVMIAIVREPLMSRASILAAFVIALASATSAAQKPLAIRQLGHLERVSHDSLASAAAAVPMPGGRVLVNDISARRVLLFDSTLTHATVVADTSRRHRECLRLETRHAHPISGRHRHLRRHRIRIDARDWPRRNDRARHGGAAGSNTQLLIGSIFGTPAFDAHGRLVYYGGGGIGLGGLTLCCVGAMPANGLGSEFLGVSDSAFIVRADLATRTIDTASVIKIPRVKTGFNADARGKLLSIETTRYPLPIVDDWTVTPDGSLVVVRGRDYHVDWLGADGRLDVIPQNAFGWQHVDDARKQALIDSAAKDPGGEEKRDSTQAAASCHGGSGAVVVSVVDAVVAQAEAAQTHRRFRISRPVRRSRICLITPRRSSAVRSARTPITTCGSAPRRWCRGSRSTTS